MFKWYSFFYFQNTFKIITNLLSHSIVAFSDYLFHLFYNLLCCCFFFFILSMWIVFAPPKKKFCPLFQTFFFIHSKKFFYCALYIYDFIFYDIFTNTFCFVFLFVYLLRSVRFVSYLKKGRKTCPIYLLWNDDSSFFSIVVACSIDFLTFRHHYTFAQICTICF